MTDPGRHRTGSQKKSLILFEGLVATDNILMIPQIHEIFPRRLSIIQSRKETEYNSDSCRHSWKAERGST